MKFLGSLHEFLKINFHHLATLNFETFTELLKYILTI